MFLDWGFPVAIIVGLFYCVNEIFLEKTMNLHLKLQLHHQRDEIIDEYFIMGQLRQDLILQANSDNKITLELYTGRFFNNWVDVTGYSFDFIAKNNPTDADGDAVLSYHVDSFQDPTHGKAVIIIPKSDCEDLISNYFYQIKMTNAHGKVRPIKLGIVTFLQDLMSS